MLASHESGRVEVEKKEPNFEYTILEDRVNLESDSEKIGEHEGKGPANFVGILSSCHLDLE